MSEPAISLHRYSQRIGYGICAFWGVRHPSDPDYACRRVWSLSERNMIEWALLEAQGEIEQEVGYFLAPSWVTAERHAYKPVLHTRMGHVIAGGVLSVTTLGAAVAPDYTADPATVTVALGTCDPANVHVYLAGTDIEVTPDGYTLAGGNIVLSIPWCRLVALAYRDNPDAGLDYADAATWRAAAVDVKCRANSTATQATLVYRVSCTCGVVGCSHTTKTGCIYVRNGERGTVDVTRANYAAGVWTAVTTCCCDCAADWVELNYYSGMTPLTRQAEDAIIRLAHAKMSEEPCGCAVTQNLWKRDRNTPDLLTRERINCPFGTSDGAWWAWRQAQAMKLWRGSVL